MENNPKIIPFTPSYLEHCCVDFKILFEKSFMYLRNKFNGN